MSDLETLQQMLSNDSADFEAERLILAASEMILELMDGESVSRSELASRIGKSKGHISQLLNGERNMTLRTLAELTHALGTRATLTSARTEAEQADSSAHLERAWVLQRQEVWRAADSSREREGDRAVWRRRARRYGDLRAVPDAAARPDVEPEAAIAS